MGSIELQRRPLYGIGTVARLTGIKPDTLRVWERRYRLGASHKSQSGRRLYTQSDLEHLQMVGALVASGTRIGEIASAERRTLEVLLRSRSKHPEEDIPESKPRIVLVGSALCDWLEEHQGCLASVDAMLLRCPLEALDKELLRGIEDVDGIVLEVAGDNEATLRKIASLTEMLGTTNVLVLHRYSNAKRMVDMEKHGYTSAAFPPDPSILAFHFNYSVAVKEAGLGSQNTGELVRGKPRLFNEEELSVARKLSSSLDCECTRHITDLVRSLVAFEEYSANCSAETWQDAAAHACIYTYTGQARWLMEKALGVILEEHDEKALQKH